MAVDTKIDFENLRREGANVVGKLYASIYGDVFGSGFDEKVFEEDFIFPSGGEQEVYNQEIAFKVGPLDVNGTLSVKVHEQTEGQCCVQGHVHIDPGPGGGVGKDLDPNCHPIP